MNPVANFFQALAEVAKITLAWFLITAAIVAMVLGSIICVYQNQNRGKAGRDW